MRVTTTVPADTRDGSYRCAVMFEFDPPGADRETARKDMQFRGRVATLVYATVGAPKTAIELDDLQVQPVPNGAPNVVATAEQHRPRLRPHQGHDGHLRRPTAASCANSRCPTCRCCRRARVSCAISDGGAAGHAPLEPGLYKVEVRIDVGQTALLVGETTLEVSRIR